MLAIITTIIMEVTKEEERGIKEEEYKVRRNIEDSTKYKSIFCKFLLETIDFLSSVVTY
jgi:hypothetical protein